jgi:hypothetical protein
VRIVVQVAGEERRDFCVSDGALRVAVASKFHSLDAAAEALAAEVLVAWLEVLAKAGASNRPASMRVSVWPGAPTKGGDS